MRPADSWKDYELLDATDGNRLERWGRPSSSGPTRRWCGKPRNRASSGPRPMPSTTAPMRGAASGSTAAVCLRSGRSCGEGEDKLTLIVSPTGFKHTGVFPEQAVNWAWYARKIRAAGRPVKVLNLFGYTGGATLACAAAGAAVVCHVEASQGHRSVGQGQRRGQWSGGPRRSAR